MKEKILNHYLIFLNGKALISSVKVFPKIRLNWLVCKVSLLIIRILQQWWKIIKVQLLLMKDYKASSENLQKVNTHKLACLHPWCTHLKWLSCPMSHGNKAQRNSILSQMILGSKVDYHQWLNKLITAQEHQALAKSIQVRTVDSAWSMASSMRPTWEEDRMATRRQTSPHKVHWKRDRPITKEEHQIVIK